MGDARGCWFAFAILVHPVRGYRIEDHNGVALSAALGGAQIERFEVKAPGAVIGDPVSDVILANRRGTHVGPTEKVRMPEGPVAFEIGGLYVFPIGVFEFPDGPFVGWIGRNVKAGTWRATANTKHDRNLLAGVALHDKTLRGCAKALPAHGRIVLSWREGGRDQAFLVCFHFLR